MPRDKTHIDYKLDFKESLQLNIINNIKEITDRNKVDKITINLDGHSKVSMLSSFFSDSDIVNPKYIGYSFENNKEGA